MTRVWNGHRDNWKERPSAVALIVVLWAVALLGTIALVLGRQSRTEIKITKNLIETAQAQALAEAGVYRSIGELLRDADQDVDGGDDPRDYWADNDASFRDVPLGRGIYRVTHPNPASDVEVAFGLLDECSKLNINVATKEMLMTLPNMTEEAADSILDWRDEDDTPNANGAETSYYEALFDPYQAKNGMFDTLEELLLVRGVTPDLFYGEDTNGNGILDPNENDGDLNFPPDNSDGVLDRGWAAWLTCYSYEKNADAQGEDRVNLNTATEEQLTESLGEYLTADEISRIIQARGDQQDAYKGIGDLMAAMEEIQESTGQPASQGGQQQPRAQGSPGSAGQPGQSGRSGEPRQSNQQLQPGSGRGSEQPGGTSGTRGKTLGQRAGPGREGGTGGGGGDRVEPAQPRREGGEQRGPSQGQGGQRPREGVARGPVRGQPPGGTEQGGRRQPPGETGQGGRRQPPGEAGQGGRGGPGGGGPGGGGGGGGGGGERTSQGPILSVEKFRQIADKVCVNGDKKFQGRININTASQTVLKAVFQDHPEVADAIIAYRETEKFPFDDLGELLDLQGMTQEIFREISERLSVRSSTFSGQSVGYLPVSGAYKELRVVLDRAEDTPRIVYWKVVR